MNYLYGLKQFHFIKGYIMNNQTFPQFDNYVCPGDTITWPSDGFDFVARVECDHDTKPTDSDCYNEADIERWNNDEWFYVGIVVSVSFKGVQLSDHAASLWGIDCNFKDDNSYLSEVAKELEYEALIVARAKVASLRVLFAEEDDTGLTRADLQQFHGPSVRI